MIVRIFFTCFFVFFLFLTSLGSPNLRSRRLWDGDSHDEYISRVLQEPTELQRKLPLVFKPSYTPTPKPSVPTGQPSQHPTKPTGQPSRQPTMQPSRQPTSQPTRHPTRQPTVQVPYTLILLHLPYHECCYSIATSII